MLGLGRDQAKLSVRDHCPLTILTPQSQVHVQRPPLVPEGSRRAASGPPLAPGSEETSRKQAVQFLCPHRVGHTSALNKKDNTAPRARPRHRKKDMMFPAVSASAGLTFLGPKHMQRLAR